MNEHNFGGELIIRRPYCGLKKYRTLLIVEANASSLGEDARELNDNEYREVNQRYFNEPNIKTRLSGASEEITVNFRVNAKFLDIFILRRNIIFL